LKEVRHWQRLTVLDMKRYTRESPTTTLETCFATSLGLVEGGCQHLRKYEEREKSEGSGQSDKERKEMFHRPMEKGGLV
jgi:hypothetical protein